MKKSHFIFPVLVFFSLLFIVVSGFFVVKVNNLQTQLKKNAELISLSSDIEEKTFTLLSGFDYYATNATNDGVETLVNQSLAKAKEHKLVSLSNKLVKLQTYAEVNITGNRTKTIQGLLFGVQRECKNLIRANRVKVDQITTSLSDYWKFTYYLIGASCLLALILAYVGYLMFSAKTRIDDLTTIKSLFLNKSIDVVVTCDKKGKITEFNKAAELAFGYTKKELMGKSISRLYSDTNQALAVREEINLNDSFLGEIKNRKKNGEIFVSQLSANILRNEKGKAIGTMGISRDITNKKELETSFELIVNNVADIVYSCNQYGEFSFVNQAVIDILGYSSEELLGKPFTAIIKKEDLPRVAAKYFKQFTNRERVSYDEFAVVSKDGTFTNVSQSVRLVMSETHPDKVIGVHGIARNMDAMTKSE